MKARTPVIPGFFFSALAAGLKKNHEKDMALIFSATPAVAAGVFTRNWVKAAPVVLTQKRLEKGYFQAVLVNSGCANACTGKQGMEDATALTKGIARLLGIAPGLVAVASTGVIGAFLPAKKMLGCLPALCAERREGNISDFAQAIMTTDTVSKIAARERIIEGKRLTVAGVAKGAGMINPSLATMLVFLLTNASVRPKTLQALLKEGAERSFNRITVDGDTSTNDTVLLLANGAANNPPLSKRAAAATGFTTMVFEVMEELAGKIIQDGEGATKMVEIKVRKARSRREAEAIARSIACSPLVKTALFGEEANWGRIVSAAGKTEFPVSFETMGLDIGCIPLVRRGKVLNSGNEEKAQQQMKRKSYSIVLVLNQGNHDFSILTTDFSPRYVTINAGYKS